MDLINVDNVDSLNLENPLAISSARLRLSITAATGCLPYDIVLEILSRLPTRSLLRFSCAAKSWNSLIFSNHFSKKHFRYLNNKFEYRIMLAADDGFKLEHLSLHSTLNNLKVPVFGTSIDDKFPITNPSFYATFHGEELVKNRPIGTLIGSCNGLICIIAVATLHLISNDDLVYFWNPSIQKSQKITSFGDEPGYSVIRFYGFGFDASSDSYKVVAFYFSCTDEYDVLVKSFSVKTGEFKRIKNHPGRWLKNHLTCCMHATFANGKIHWFVEEKPENFYIAYLDLTTEQYGKIEKPDYIHFSRNSDSTMMELPGGALYVYSGLSRQNTNGELIAWLVKPKYGFGEATWAQVVVNVPIYFGLNFGYGNPLFMLDNGTTLWLRDGNIILIFNPNDLSVRHCRLTGPNHSLTDISYIESLVSPEF